MKRIALIFLSFTSVISTFAQRPIESSADILHELKKLNVLGNVLYIAAHPDDENTRLIAWLENEKNLRTAYLSLTRGDGGQNLIGTEKGDALGVIRTQELLEARKIDGAEQFFSRAVDFGYSKTATETFEKWNKEKVLGDVVWTIRKFKPDVIITRFPPDERAGHGHHTASALLAEEAFRLAADSSAYPEQFDKPFQEREGLNKMPFRDCYVCEPWQAKRVLWNTSVWWDRTLPEKAAKSKDYVTVNIGDYNELLGLSYSEIASDSRSQHKSQGFGTERSRGNQLEYLKHTAGEQAKEDLFEGINTTWSRVQGSEQIQEKLNAIINNYDLSNPSKSVKALVELYQLMEEKKDNFYVQQKLAELRRIIKAAAGIHVEILADDYNYPAFQVVPVNGSFQIINRSHQQVLLKGVHPAVDSSFTSIALPFNELIELRFHHSIAIHPSHPYWLSGSEMSTDEMSEAKLKIDASIPKEMKEQLIKSFSQPYDFFSSIQEQYGLAENLPKVSFRYLLEIEGVDIYFDQAIDYKWSDRVDGELHRDVIVSPEITATPSKGVYISTDQTSKKIDVLLEAHKDSIQNTIRLIAPEGWKVSPESIAFELKKKGDQQLLSFQLSPPSGTSVGEIGFRFNRMIAQSVQRINYPHIRPQVLFPTAKAKVVKMNIARKVNRIAYINGSGDEVAEYLKQVGYTVSLLNASDLPVTDLSQFEAIVVGIRAYNTEESMQNGNDILNEYVKQGGTVVVQYNTSRGLKASEIGPYPFHLSRNRVTKEEAEPTFLKAKHPLLNQPNKLEKSDFDHWVQERGLYFADEWDKHYETVIAWNDPGEEPQEGSILVTDYGNGHFIYTGISFFRQLPAGVPGAYRLLSNMISYGK
jgi:LmbE family N-acetylglucosaminyl deacetylase